MSKSIVVIDTPKSCIECPCMSWDSEDDWIGCHLTSRQTGVWSKQNAKKPNWCPLKPLPTKVEMRYIPVGTMDLTKRKRDIIIHNIDKENAYVQGYNDCLEEITGETE